MKIGIVGLGLIGGSLAMSIRKHTEHTVFGYDIDPQVMLRAKAVEAIHDGLTEDLLPGCDIVLVALFPQLCADWIVSHADQFGPKALVIDCAGVKRCVCNQVEPVAAKPDAKAGFVILHRCTVCGELHPNKAAYGSHSGAGRLDSTKLLIALTARPWIEKA